MVVNFSFFVFILILYKVYENKILWRFFVVTLFVTIVFWVLHQGFNWLFEQGRETAKKQNNFPVLEEASSNSEAAVKQYYAVIRNYGDYLYAVPFNRATNEFEKKLVIIKMSESAKQPLTLSLEIIGPLKEMSSKNEQ
jgi:hypothetical protein